jgi:hypothetical protein
MKAVRNGHGEIVSLLLQHIGTDVSIANKVNSFTSC